MFQYDLDCRFRIETPGRGLEKSSPSDYWRPLKRLELSLLPQLENYLIYLYKIIGDFK